VKLFPEYRRLLLLDPQADRQGVAQRAIGQAQLGPWLAYSMLLTWKPPLAYVQWSSVLPVLVLRS